jgi:hypothetical protein
MYVYVITGLIRLTAFGVIMFQPYADRIVDSHR